MDLYTRQSMIKLGKFLATFAATVAVMIALIRLIGPEEFGILFAAVAFAYLCYHFVITDADIARRHDELSKKYNKE